MRRIKSSYLLTTLLILLIIVASVGYVYSVTPTDGEPQMRTTFSADPGPIAVYSIAPYDTVPQKFILNGEADGAWFFESSMPAEVRTPDGKILWQDQAWAQGDYMLEGTVMFTAEVDVGTYEGPAVVILMRANESDDSSYDKSYTIPITVVKVPPVSETDLGE